MSILRLGIYVEELEDVYREIEVKDTQTFMEFHEAIVKAFQLKKKVQASFFISNNRWQKLNEVTLGYSSVFDKALNGAEVFIGSVMPSTTKFLIYFNEELSEYTILIQLEGIDEKEDKKKTYPALVAANGKLSFGFGTNIFSEDLGINEGDLSEESGFSDVADLE